MRLLLHLLAAAGAGGAFAQSPQTPIEWTVLIPERAEALSGRTLEPQTDGSLLVREPGPATDVYTIECTTELKGITGLRLEAIPDENLPQGGSGWHASGDFVLSELTVESSFRGQPVPLVLRNASASYSHDYWPVAGAVDGRAQTGWAVGPDVTRTKTAVFELGPGLRSTRETRLTFRLEFHYGEQATLGRFRLSATTTPPPLRAPVEVEAWRDMPARINRAIDDGVACLISQQELDGSWAAYQDKYRNGQTALAVYTLLKSGVPANHQAVLRGLAYLRTAPVTMTYSLACQLLAFTSLKDPEYEERIRDLGEGLVSWHIGGFSYPAGNDADLSNTQFGALGLWAAALAGVEVPDRVWYELGARTLEHQERQDDPYGPAGFAYLPVGSRPGSENLSHATGSMTAAGVSILAICQQMLGPKKTPNAFVRGQRMGNEWLARHFSASSEPRPHTAGAGGWVHYYLYAIERVGALTGERFIGGSDWYMEGARYLVEEQLEGGAWTARGTNQQPNTCFALLFLSRATAPPSTGPGLVRSGKLYGDDDPTRSVSLRASGDTPLTAWISSFGDHVLEASRWPGEETLRIAKVEYLTSGNVLVPDARTNGSEWRFTFDRPGERWTEPGFDDRRWSTGPGAFGHPETPGACVRTEWKSGGLWLRRTFSAEDPIEPVLYLQNEGTAPIADAQRSAPRLVALFDEDGDFPPRLNQKVGESFASLTDDSHNGPSALRLTGVAVHSPQIPGWGFRIARQPGPGEFRYLRFAWKKVDGDGIMMQLAENGRWTDESLLYYSGENEVRRSDGGLRRGTRVSRSIPKQWTEVTRDLYDDFGGETSVTGLALLQASGEVLVDAIYLARSKSDFKQVPADGRPLEHAFRSGGPAGRVEIWLNGSLAHTSEGTQGYQPVLAGAALSELLVPGENVLAVHALGGNAGQVLDVGLRADRVLATVEGSADAPAGPERFAFRHGFPTPGTYPLRARVHVALPGSHVAVLESQTLSIQVDDAVDRDLLEYAADPGRNLLADQLVRCRASSEVAGWSAAMAADNAQIHAWLARDDDPLPTLELEWDEPVRADTLLLSVARADRLDPERTARIRLIEVRVNSRGERHSIELADDGKKTVWELPKARAITSLELRVLGVAPGHPQKAAVGLAEAELQLRK